MVLAIEARGLTRRFRDDRGGRGEVVALDAVDLQVRRGELFGLLGPNGAGKTTLIKILATLLLPTAGEAWVAGYDVVRQPREVRRRINMVAGGEVAGYGVLTVREQLWLFAQLYGIPSAEALRRVDALLEVVGLHDAAHTRVNRLSTGMRQRMNFARGFLNDPEVLFLDEPTLGLDVETAGHLRGYVRRWLAEDPRRTVVLTTHYLAEAEELCDRVAIIRGGRIVACDTPSALKRRLQHRARFRLEVAGLAGPAPEAALRRDLPALQRLAVQPVPGAGTLRLEVELVHDAALPPLLDRLQELGGQVLYLSRVEPTLEDVFVALVGAGSEAGGAAVAG